MKTLTSRWRLLSWIWVLFMPVAAHAGPDKFYAWTTRWIDGPIPLQIGGLDPRQYREYTCDPGPGAASFAAANPGHLYIVCDEPDIHAIPAATYAQQYHDFVAAVSAADPTARFSPAGIAQPVPPPTCGGVP